MSLRAAACNRRLALTSGFTAELGCGFPHMTHNFWLASHEPSIVADWVAVAFVRPSLALFLVKREPSHSPALSSTMAAAAGAAPVAPAPVVVVVARVVDTSDHPISLSQNEAIYINTAAILPWAAHGASAAGPTAGLAHNVAASVFFIRCTFSGSLATRNILANQSVFTVTFTAACWSRVLTELCASGLLAASLTSVTALRDAMRSLTIVNPANLVILDTDIVLADSFDAPGSPAVPGVPARRAAGGRRAAPAVPAVPPGPPAPGPPALLFLHLASPLLMAPPDTPSSYQPFAILQGLLGPCLTRAARADAMSTCQMVAGILRPHLERRVFGSVNIADHLVASQLTGFLTSLAIPEVFQLDTLNQAEIVPDLVACLRYTYGTAEDRIIVETNWLPRVTGLPVLYATFVADSPTLAVTRSQVSSQNAERGSPPCV